MSLRIMILTLVGLMLNCVESQTVRCGTSWCGQGYACHQDLCVDPRELAACAALPEATGCTTLTIPAGVCLAGRCEATLCGDGRRDAREACDDGNQHDGDGCAANCLSSERCGNGLVDRALGEECDDGNLTDADACHRDCRVPRCGDTIVDAHYGEACDLGEQNSHLAGHACRPDCQPARCGDGIVDPNEACDDGNVYSNDGCAGDCRSNETCGNGYPDLARGEHCDDGNASNEDGCRNDCTLATCGDGEVNRTGGEGCDNGAANADTPNAPCRTNCQPQRCGDGIVDADEACDDGNTLAGDGCRHDCAALEYCGNGLIDASRGEECDDGNQAQVDACHADCRRPRCGDGIVDPQQGETCDEGGANANLPGASCRADCQPRRCGDGILDQGAPAYERCDDGNLTSGDGCSTDCLSDELCGNHYVDRVRGEQCDDTYPGGQAGDGCTSHCLVEPLTWRTSLGTPIAQAVAFDAARGAFVAFGGLVVETVLSGSNTTWDISPQGWRPHPTAAAPPPTAWGTMAYEPATHTMLLAAPQLEAATETWRFDGTTWRQLAITGELPRAGLAMAHNPLEALTLLHGEAEPGLAATWLFAQGRWEPVVSGPAARREAAMAMHPDLGGIMLVGGGDGQQDAWLYRDGSWTSLPPTPIPVARARMAYDEHRHVMVLVTNYQTLEFTAQGTWQVGPDAPIGFPLAVAYAAQAGHMLAMDDDSTWSYDGTTWTAWGHPPKPPARLEGNATYDEHRRRFIVFGGTDLWSYLDDTWEYDGAWQRVRGPGPSGRLDACLAYDGQRQVVVLFGGYGASGTGEADTWEYNGAWQRVQLAHAPSARWAHDCVYSAREGAVIMYGGRTLNTWLDETWRYDGQWQQLSPASAPPARGYHRMAYDAAHERIVMFGGAVEWGTATGRKLGDAWAFQDQQWQRLALRRSPPPSFLFTMYFDAAQQRLVLIDETTQAWRLEAEPALTFTPAASPHPTGVRVGAVSAYDPNTLRAKLFGGINTSSYALHANLLELGYLAPADLPDACLDLTHDTDGDGRLGCDDPDCRYRCAPGCAPLTSCDLTNLPHCGDGVCDQATFIEDYLICPSDCAAP